MADPQRVYRYPFSAIHDAYVQKAERKGRTRDEVDELFRWLTGYSQPQLEALLESETQLGAFYTEAPALNPERSQITGVVCEVRLEEIEDPLMREIRRMDKLVDELARGKAMEKILRAPKPA